MNSTIFKKEYSSLFTQYGYGVATINHILHSVGHNLTNLHTDEARKKGLEVIYQLLKYDLVKITFLDGKNVKDNQFKLSEKMSMIEKLWNKGETDFESIVNFDFKGWYYKKLSELKINENTDWEWFGEEFVPNMKQWIEENRPK